MNTIIIGIRLGSKTPYSEVLNKMMQSWKDTGKYPLELCIPNNNYSDFSEGQKQDIEGVISVETY